MSEVLTGRGSRFPGNGSLMPGPPNCPASVLKLMVLPFLQEPGSPHPGGEVPTPWLLHLCRLWAELEDARPLLGGQRVVLREACPPALFHAWNSQLSSLRLKVLGLSALSDSADMTIPRASRGGVIAGDR